MEHRWGVRHRLNLLVGLDCGSNLILLAHLGNASASDAYIETRAAIPLWTHLRVDLEVEFPRRHSLQRIPAYVVRKDAGGVGLEWCEFAPERILDLLAGRERAIRRHQASSVSIGELHRIEATLQEHSSLSLGRTARQCGAS